MALILHIETATKNCSVSLSEDEQLLYVKEFNDQSYSHGELLHVFIEELFIKAGKPMSDLAAVAVSEGPGSYTGLRIGVATAKGLCYSLQIPLLSVSTLGVLARAIKVNKGDVIIPLLDARRMEVYSAVFDHEYVSKREIKAEVLDKNSFSAYLNKGVVHFIGDGAEKCSQLIKHKNAVFKNGYYPSSQQMPISATSQFNQKKFKDLAYFEPLYLKEFLVTPSKKKLV